MKLDRREMLGLIAALSVAHLPSLASAGRGSLTHSVTLPTDARDGDLLILGVCSRSAVSFDAGWTLVASEKQDNGYIGLASRGVDAGMPKSVTLSADQETQWAYALYHFSEAKGHPELCAVLKDEAL